MSQSVWGPDPPDYLAPRVMPEAVCAEDSRGRRGEMDRDLHSSTEDKQNSLLCNYVTDDRIVGSSLFKKRCRGMQTFFFFLSRAGNLES